MNGDTNTRIRSVELWNFRGWTVAPNEQPHVVDLAEATLFVLAGANGTGKSSLLEAMAILLTGCAAPRGTSGWNAHENARQGGSWKLSLNGTQRSARWNKSTNEVSWSEDRSPATAPELLNVPFSHLPGTAWAPLLLRATAYLQEWPTLQFEDPRHDDWGGQSLVDFLAPPPIWLNRLQEAMREVRREMLDIIDHASLRPDVAAARSAFERAGQSAMAAWRTAALQLGDGPDRTPDVTEVEGFAGVQRFAARLWPRAEQERSTTLDALIGVVHERLRQEQGRLRSTGDVTALLAEIEATETLWSHHHRDFPNVEALADWFESRDGVPLLAALDALSAMPRGWRRIPPDSGDIRAFALHDLIAALSRVDQAVAANHSSVLRDWQQKVVRTLAEQRRLEEQLRRLNGELEQSRRSGTHLWQAVAVRLEDALAAERQLMVAEAYAGTSEAIQRRAAVAHRLRGELEAELEWLDNQARNRLPASARDMISEAIAAVSQLLGVDLDVQARRDGTGLSFHELDGRELLNHFSTGQKAMAALTVLVAWQSLLERWMPHRVILIDDLAGALDLGNFVGVSVLLRKLAYGSGNERRQVIITAHDDDLVHRLFALLLPPGDEIAYAMHFTGWEIGRGPAFEKRVRLRGTRRADEALAVELAARLDEATLSADQTGWYHAARR